MNCKSCNKELEIDEIAIYKKLVNRGAHAYLCIDCLSSYFQCPSALIYEKIVHFKASGCQLFTKEQKE
jgi:NAD-dependent dihydropyrimidine dehydrogenase PreA subunit